MLLDGEKMGHSKASLALFLLGIGKLIKTFKNPHFSPCSTILPWQLLHGEGQ